MPIFNHIPELIIVMVLGLLIFGPKRLPEMGNAVGKTIKEFQKTMKSVSEPEKTPVDAPPALPTASEPVASAVVVDQAPTSEPVQNPTSAAV